MFRFLEENPFFFAVAFLAVFSIAGLVEILPDFAQSSRPTKGLKPYTPLEIAGRQVYINESCNACHSQLVRPFKSETDRYGMYSMSGEYAYDRPFLWGSKRTGPDLHRVGDYRSTDWQETHMWDPTALVPGSIMPAYRHQFEKAADLETAYAEAYTVKKIFGVPYDQPGMPKLGTFEEAKENMLAQAREIAKDMRNKDVKEALEQGEIKEIIAIIAYMNGLSRARREN